MTMTCSCYIPEPRADPTCDRCGQPVPATFPRAALYAIRRERAALNVRTSHGVRPADQDTARDIAARERALLDSWRRTQNPGLEMAATLEAARPGELVLNTWSSRRRLHRVHCRWVKSTGRQPGSRNMSFISLESAGRVAHWACATCHPLNPGPV